MDYSNSYERGFHRDEDDYAGATPADSAAPGDGRARAIGAAFADREAAHDAVHRLHDEGFRDTWLGITRREDSDGYAPDDLAAKNVPVGTSPPSYDTRVESENWFMRFFGEGDESLYDALVRHGVSAADATAAGPLVAGSAVLIVDGGNHPELAAQILTENGGQLLTAGFGATGYGTPEVDPQLATAQYDDYGRYRAGVNIDEGTRVQLRQERLRVDKSPVAAATVGSDVATQTYEVPFVREDVFIERRSASGSAVSDHRSTGNAEDVRAPLV